jgi:hypothetical protein
VTLFFCIFVEYKFDDMKKIIFLSLIFLAFKLNAQSTKTISGVKFPTNTTVGTKELVLNGGGLREKYFFDLYVAALYLKAKSNEAGKVVYNDAEMAIHIKIVSDKVTREKFIETVKEGFATVTHGKATKDQINKFTGFFSDDIKKGDKIHLEFVPGTGLQVKKNGTLKGTIAGLEFKQALFSIWLGDKPVDDDLKKELLGK